MAKSGSRRYEDTLSIYDCVIAGSHDSGAYVIDRTRFARSAPRVLTMRVVGGPLHGVIDAFSRTQGADIYTQLKAGVRFLDLRVSKLHPLSARNDNRFWIVHGPAACVALDDVLHQINRFHDEAHEHHHSDGMFRPQCVITVVRPLRLEEHEVEELAHTIQTLLKHEVYSGSASELRKIALREVPRNIVAGVKSLGQLDDFRWAADEWIDTYDVDKKVALLGNEVKRAVPRAERDTLHVLGFTVTPQAYHFVFRVLSLGLYRDTLLKTAQRLNETRLISFVQQHRDEVRRGVNVVFFDAVSKLQADAVYTQLPPERPSDTALAQSNSSNNNTNNIDGTCDA